MKASVIESYGSPEKFAIKELKSPSIQNGQILIRNKASSVNPVDTIVREGKLKLLTGLSTPKVIGADFSGVVLESKSKRFKVGDEVFGFISAIKGAAYAEEVAVDEDNAALKPQNLSFAEAAALPLAACTAYQGMVYKGNLKSGMNVLINGCTGGVGSAAVQIAKSFGAKVTGTASGKNEEFARQLGCDHFLDYKKEKIPQNHSFDLIFDVHGHMHFNEVAQALTDEGILVSTRGGGADDFKEAMATTKDLLFERRCKLIVVKSKSEDLERLKELVEAGKLKSYLGKTFPLAQLKEAHNMMQEGGFTGKIAVEI